MIKVRQSDEIIERAPLLLLSLFYVMLLQIQNLILFSIHIHLQIDNQLMYNTCENICLIVGIIFVVSKFLELLYRLIIIPVNRYKTYGGGWAVVTGGSDGIGLGFCEQLAKDGFNICIVGRNRSKIEKVCQKLTKDNKIETKIVIADFNDCAKDEKFFEKIMKEIQKLEVSILVNNVGILIETGPFGTLPPQKIQDELSINLLPEAMMTRLILPQMLQRFQQKKQKSLVINLASFLSIVPAKQSADYSSTKLFDDFLSRALGYEYQGKIDFLSVRPGLVTTPMTRNTESAIHVSKDQCVKGALKAAGKREFTYGHWWHEIHGYLAGFFSEQVKIRLIAETQMMMGKKYQELDKAKNA